MTEASKQKECFKCKEVKPVSEFYAHKAMADGLLGKCKECTKSDVHAYRRKNIEALRRYDRARGDDPKRKAARRRYRQTISAERMKAYKERWQAQNKEKRAAHIAVGNAFRDGKLEKQPCERCGERLVQAHHEDYSRPFDITWLCRACHGQRHREINELTRFNTEAAF